MSHRALIVDDEPLARLRLRKLLEAHPTIEVVAEAANVGQARQQLSEHDIELVFVDVQMPGGSGFELCDGTIALPRVIFVTAYEQHALRAFEVNALDYLLKPVHPERLAHCLSRLSEPQKIGAPLAETDRVTVPQNGGLRLVPVHSLLYIRAEGDYTEIHLRSGESLLCSISMRQWEQRLPENSFVRIHRSSIVAIAAIERLEREGSAYCVILRTSEARLEVSRRCAKDLRARLRAE